MDQKERKLSGAYLGVGYYFAVFTSIGISSLGIFFQKDLIKNDLKMLD